MFKTTHPTTTFVAYSRAQALENWRDAAGLARLRWWAFLDADGDDRSRAFAAYVAALDAEEAAAAELELLCDVAA